MWIKKSIILFCLTFLLTTSNAQRRVRVQSRPAPQPQINQYDSDYDNVESDNQQYYNEPEQKPLNQKAVQVADNEYNGRFGQQNSNQRQQQDRYISSVSPTKAPAQVVRTKEQTKAPPVQTIRNYNKVNDDGSFTFGYEAADGSFKEETRGTDCVVRGKYGYVDPDGNKRQFTYVSGNPCDPNNPDEQDEPEQSEENSGEPENIPNFQNYPKRPPVRIQNTPARVATTTTSRPPTTVFQNNYNYDDEGEEEQEVTQTPVPNVQPARVNNAYGGQLNNIGFRNTVQQPTVTPASQISYNTSPIQSVSITPRPTYRTPVQSFDTQPPATTYRPPAQLVNHKQKVKTSPLSVIPVTTPQYSQNKFSKNQSNSPLNFAAEFQKFQQEHNVLTTPVPPVRYQNEGKFKVASPVTSNPIYESQLVYDPQTGQYDSALYQQLPQTNGDFSISQRIQPYVHQLQQQQNSPQLVTLQHLQQKSPLYSKPTGFGQSAIIPQIPQFSQQVYQKQHDNMQVLNSQQLFAQQQELQQAQLQLDRFEAAKRQQSGSRLAVQSQNYDSTGPQTQSFYYLQPSGQTTGQIDSFLRNHNLQY